MTELARLSIIERVKVFLKYSTRDPIELVEGFGLTFKSQIATRERERVMQINALEMKRIMDSISS